MVSDQTPEKIRWQGIAILGVAVGMLALVFSGTIELSRLNRLRRDGRDARATVLEVAEDDGGGAGRERVIRYEFTPKDGLGVFRGTDSVDLGEAGERGDGKPIFVRYLEAEPSFSRVVGTLMDRVIRVRVSIVIWGVLAALLGGVGLVALRMPLKEFKTWWHARLEGREARSLDAGVLD